MGHCKGGNCRFIGVTTLLGRSTILFSYVHVVCPGQCKPLRGAQPNEKGGARANEFKGYPVMKRVAPLPWGAFQHTMEVRSRNSNMRSPEEGAPPGAGLGLGDNANGRIRELGLLTHRSRNLSNNSTVIDTSNNRSEKNAENEQENSSLMRNFPVNNGFDSNVLHGAPEGAEKYCVCVLIIVVKPRVDWKKSDVSKTCDSYIHFQSFFNS